MKLICVEDFEKVAANIIEKRAFDYYRSGAGEEITLRNNRDAFKRLRLRARCLRNVADNNLSCKIFGETIAWPVGVAPTAMQKMAYPSGEIASARAAGNCESIFILSTLSTTSIEDVSAAAPKSRKWFQLYIYKNRCLTEQMIRRAEQNDFKAIVLTVDAPVFGQRRADIRNNFRLPSHLQLANFMGTSASEVGFNDRGSSLNDYVSKQFDNTVTWEEISWIRELTKLPIIVKGVLTKEDAILAFEYGCDGLIVSNHGARQVDTVPASIEALPEIVEAVGHKLVVMFDGGIMQGNDIFKALALGAKMVFVGRPVIWGLACEGQRGVERVLNFLKAELSTTMSLMGCKQLHDIEKSMVSHESHYAKI